MTFPYFRMFRSDDSSCLRNSYSLICRHPLSENLPVLGTGYSNLKWSVYYNKTCLDQQNVCFLTITFLFSPATANGSAHQGVK